MLPIKIKSLLFSILVSDLIWSFQKKITGVCLWWYCKKLCFLRAHVSDFCYDLREITWEFVELIWWCRHINEIRLYRWDFRVINIISHILIRSKHDKIATQCAKYWLLYDYHFVFISILFDSSISRIVFRSSWAIIFSRKTV